MDAPLQLLAFDLGAESGRAMLGSFDGAALQLQEVHRFANIPAALPDGLHWNVTGLWNEIRSGLARAAQDAGGALAGVGVDTWGVDFGLLDRHGALLGIPYHYRDDRTDGIMEAAFQRVPRAELFAQTGIQFLPFNSIYQLFSLVMKNSPTLSNAETFLTMPDLLNYWLTGTKGCEFTNATTTQCYDPRRRTWARPLLERLSIPTHIFPEIIPPGTIIGSLRRGIGDELRLPNLPVVAPACHDTGSAVAAVPAEGRDFIWISSGTWSIMGVEVQEPVINDAALEASLTNEGGAGHTFRLSKNIMGLWPVQEARRTWKNQGKVYGYEELTDLAAAAQPLSHIVDPDHVDFLKPGDMPERLREYCRRTGQPIPQGEGEVVRAFLEGLALKYRMVLEHLEQLLGKRLEPIHIVGGGTRNTLLSQLTADCTGRTVVTGPIEATAAGNLLLQALALGHLSSIDDLRAVVRRSFDVQHFEPTLAKKAAWDDAYIRLQSFIAHTLD